MLEKQLLVSSWALGEKKHLILRHQVTKYLELLIMNGVLSKPPTHKVIAMLLQMGRAQQRPS